MANNQKDYYIREYHGSFDDIEDINHKIKDSIIFGLSTLALAGVVFGVGDQFINNETFQNIIAFGAAGVSGVAFNNLRKNLQIKSGLPTINVVENPKQYSKTTK